LHTNKYLSSFESFLLTSGLESFLSGIDFENNLIGLIPSKSSTILLLPWDDDKAALSLPGILKDK
jgi:hypothetical protein